MKTSYRIFATAGLAALTATAVAPARAQDATADQATAQQSAQLDRALRQDPELGRRVRIGLNIAPVPLDLSHKSVALVGLGSYFVNAVGGSNDCHTNPSYAPGGNPFMGQPKQINVAGYLAGGQHFGPGIISRNLTPQNGLPGGRTFAQFTRIMRTGIDLDHATPQYGPLLQVMPWPDYQSMTDTDLLAIYTYLSAIPAIVPKN